eukprot:7427006-Alexandrium_andersonii.AAC.1
MCIRDSVVCGCAGAGVRSATGRVYCGDRHSRRLSVVARASRLTPRLRTAAVRREPRLEGR